MADSTATSDGRCLRVGVLGCGPVAQAAHFEACRKAENAELYALCDVADDLRERMAAVHQPRTQYADYDDLLTDSSEEYLLPGHLPHTSIRIASTDSVEIPN